MGETAAPLVPERPSLASLREAAAGCQACELYRGTTQTVFGQGAASSEVMLVGEQPGDSEDREGEPFVGPAGRELDRALEATGIERDLVYVTNAVKHFKFVQRGKRRIHRKPDAEQLAACRPWLDAEIAVVDPRVVVALGATAAKSLLGSSFRVTKQRGELVEWSDGRLVTATVHPSSILRASQNGDEERRAARAEFHSDFAEVARFVS